MRRTVLRDAVALGALSGMRSMAGMAALAFRYRRRRSLASALALGEMVADKTPWVGNRIDPLPLGGRVVMGALMGGFVAQQSRESVLAGSLAGAAAAFVAAHLAYRARTRAPLGAAAGGVLEDAVVAGAGAALARR
ncbi:MAG TPA: hypothetical protein VM364_03845 [Vicinamibacterales bacterium]|nr:hypothetical protein [Vicinamibacterales bacterium]